MKEWSIFLCRSLIIPQRWKYWLDHFLLEPNTYSYQAYCSLSCLFLAGSCRETGARLGQLQSNCELKPGIPVLTNLNCVLKKWSNTFCGRTMETSSRWLCCWIIWRAASRSESPWLGKMQPRAMGSGMRPPLCCIVSAGRRPPLAEHRPAGTWLCLEGSPAAPLFACMWTAVLMAFWQMES